MKFLRILPLLLSLFFPFLSVSAQDTEEPTSPLVITFLSKIPTQDVSDCSSENIMNLLNETGLTWITSIECDNVSMTSGNGGFYINKSGEKVPSITFNFRKDKLLKLKRVWLYGSNYLEPSINCVNPTIEINGEVVELQNDFMNKTTNLGDTDYSKWKSCNTVEINSKPLKQLKLISGSTTTEIVGMRLFFSGMEEGSEEGGDNGDENPGVSTGVAGVQQDASATYEYFDMQGRRLKCAPVSGLYIRRCAGKTEKLIAR